MYYVLINQLTAFPMYQQDNNDRILHHNLTGTLVSVYLLLQIHTIPII